MLYHAVMLFRHQTVEGVVHYLPVHQIRGVQDRQAWNAVERRCGHPVVVACPHYIGIRIVQAYDGIRVGVPVRPGIHACAQNEGQREQKRFLHCS